jgi:NAD(P)-dependent dehydrogenase (short-subunit alcohol dehydrogenase family)
MKNLFRIDERIAVVTGGGGKIGRAIVEGLATFGAKVYIADIDGEIADKYAADMKNSGFQVMAVNLDIRNPRSISSCVERVMELSGRLDVWVNSAYPRTEDWGLSLEKVSLESWRENVDGQMNGYSFCCREAAKAMRPRGNGSIINLGSTYGIVGPDFSIYEGTDMTMPAAYAAIKGGIISLTRYLASYYGKDGIRVNCISPGGVENCYPEDFVKKYERKTILGRMTAPRDIAGAAIYLASDASLYVTGHNLTVDGGWTII